MPQYLTPTSSSALLQIGASMNLHSWDRFITRALAVPPSLMGRALTFEHNGSPVTIKLPPVEKVGDVHDEDARACRGAWNGNTGEAIYFVIRSVDVCVEASTEVPVPREVLERHPNAYELISDEQQRTLQSIAEACSTQSQAAFEYWVSLLRWVSGSHKICRHVSVGNAPGWSTYLLDAATEKEVWVHSQTIVVEGYRTITDAVWEKVSQLALAGESPPIYSILYGDALDCIDEADYRRALVDLSVACEVFLRSRVIASLPLGTSDQVSRLIEEANINQLVAHLFPALLDQGAGERYKKKIKEELSSLFARRNKLMHVAELHGATLENCRRYASSARELFNLLPEPVLGSLTARSDQSDTAFI
jgi:hypothetical protein